MKSSAVKIFAKQTELMQLQNSYINDVTMRDNFVQSNFSEKTVFETTGMYLFFSISKEETTFFISESEKLLKLTNHPVHIIEEKGNILSPTALIPFCSFANNFSMMGTKITEFEVPVCNSFRAKLVKDQLCYEVDLSRFKNHINFKDKLFLTLLIDYNEDREIKKNEYPKENFVIINTIGNS